MDMKVKPERNPSRAVFLGSSLKDIRDFPEEARQTAGYQIRLVQQGDEPTDWKPLKTVGPGVREIRIADEAGAFRIVYVVDTPKCLYVLHAFKKTTQATSQKDIDLARTRYKTIDWSQ
jgi:phage-related protein